MEVSMRTLAAYVQASTLGPSTVVHARKPGQVAINACSDA
jgi:hypothetical protein